MVSIYCKCSQLTSLLLKSSTHPLRLKKSIRTSLIPPSIFLSPLENKCAVCPPPLPLCFSLNPPILLFTSHCKCVSGPVFPYWCSAFIIHIVTDLCEPVNEYHWRDDENGTLFRVLSTLFWLRQLFFENVLAKSNILAEQ